MHAWNNFLSCITIETRLKKRSGLTQAHKCHYRDTDWCTHSYPTILPVFQAYKYVNTLSSTFEQHAYILSTVSVLPLHHVICGLHVWVWNNIPCVCGIESEDIKQIHWQLYHFIKTIPFHLIPHFTSKTIPYFSTWSLHTRGYKHCIVPWSSHKQLQTCITFM